MIENFILCFLGILMMPVVVFALIMFLGIKGERYDR